MPKKNTVKITTFLYFKVTAKVATKKTFSLLLLLSYCITY